MTQRLTTRFNAFARPASLRIAGLMLLVAVTGTGCGKIFKKDKDTVEGQPVEEIYDKAHASMRNSNWAQAELNFRKLIAQYPYGPYTEQALMETAYAQYKSGKMEDAVSTICLLYTSRCV